MKIIYMKPSELKSLKKVINYNIEDEKENYFGHMGGSRPKDHIYLDLKRLSDMIDRNEEKI